ncbi:MutS domain V [Lachnospiraceae bacterium XBB2008]|nr:MutS domain V [Lachnospiraceae bacterium XBB2008]
MEALIFVLILLGIIVLIMFLQFINSRRDDKLYLLKLRKEFGNNHRSSYDHDLPASADAYFRRHATDRSLDDITWSDLSLDSIYSCIDTTESEAGHQVLYHMLRTPLFDTELIASRRRAIDHFRTHDELREKVQIVLHHVGSSGKSSIYDLLDDMKGLEEKSFTPYYVRIAALILSIVSMFFLKGFGVVIFLAVLISNLYVYYRDRAKILPYMKVYLYILKTIDAGEAIVRAFSSGDMTDPELDRLSSGIKDLLVRLKSIKRKSSFSLSSEMGNNPFLVLLSIAGVFVYADIIRFWNLKRSILDRSEDIDELIFRSGSIDAYISMAGYVQSISRRCCESTFTEEDRIDAEGIVHPLIEDPVPNTISADRSILLTGANASGKSTFLKSMALGAIYAQTIGYVCADRYAAPLCAVSSAMSVRDDIESGDSYYMVEIKAVKRIIDRYCDEDIYAGCGHVLKLCFVDELLSGTNTEERIAACTQILKGMAASGVMVMAATHDMELTELLKNDYDNYHFEEDLSEGDVRFSYKIMSGGATSRNAIRLLSSLGFDEGMVQRAEMMVRLHKAEGVWKPV